MVMRILGAAILLASSTGYSQEPSDAGTSRFARRYLTETELAAEVKIDRIYHLGMGVDVVYLDLRKVYLNRLPKDLARRKRQLLLAHRNEFTPGTTLFLLMKRYGAGDRLTSLHRLSTVEKTYREKLQLIEQYIAVERIEKAEDRARAFSVLLLSNLTSDSVWTRMNSLYELQGLVADNAFPFTTGDVAYVEGLIETREDKNFRDSLVSLCKTMGKQAIEGPPLVEDTPAGDGAVESIDDSGSSKSSGRVKTENPQPGNLQSCDR